MARVEEVVGRVVVELEVVVVWGGVVVVKREVVVVVRGVLVVVTVEVVVGMVVAVVDVAWKDILVEVEDVGDLVVVEDAVDGTGLAVELRREDLMMAAILVDTMVGLDVGGFDFVVVVFVVVVVVVDVVVVASGM